MTRLKSALDRLMNRDGVHVHRGDFSYSMYSFLISLALLGATLAALAVAFGTPAPGLAIRAFFALALASLIYLVLPYWFSSLLAAAIASAAFLAFEDLSGPLAVLSLGDWAGFPWLALAVFALVFLGPCLQVVTQWDKAVVLRLGRFRAVKGPGPFLLAPLVDRYAALVDTRIRASDFSAEKILTRDTVPIHVDALAFWMIWDAQKAILEVENFLEAVTLSAQTALRDSVGKYSLTTLLSERETLYREIQAILDAKTNPWGITILSVEFVDIHLPPELEDSMSKVAQAEREKKARMLLAEAELDVAAKYVGAAQVYGEPGSALKLRSMSMVYDAMKARGSVVVVPSQALGDMDLGAAAAAAKLAGKDEGGA